MKTIFHHSATLLGFLLSVVIILLLIASIFQSCQQVECDSCTTQTKKTTVRKTMSKAFDFDEVRHVSQSGMHYALIYYNGIHVVNITNDSLTLVSLKTQQRKDSLQIEVFKKYLSK